MFKKKFLVLLAVISLLSFQTACDKDTGKNPSEESSAAISETEKKDEFVEEDDKIGEEKKDKPTEDEPKEEEAEEKDEDKEDEVDEEEPEKNDLPEEEVEKEDISVKEEKKTPEGEELEDGIYTSSMMADLEGELNNEFPTVYKIEIKNGYLIVYGSLGKMKNEDTIGFEKTLDNNSYYVELSDSSQFSLMGGQQKPQILEAEEFENYFKQVENSGLGLVLEIKDGKLYLASISS